MNNFAIVIHPIEPQKGVARKYPLFGKLPPRVIDYFSRFFPPVFLSHIVGARSEATGEEIEGWLLACPMTPKRMLEVRTSIAYHKIVQTGRLAERLGAGEYFKFNDVEEFWKTQLEGTSVKLSDFDKKGSVSLADKEIWWDRMKDLKFKTPSKKIEFVSSLLEENGILSFKPYETPKKPKAGTFRLTYGRSPVHTHGRTMNNPILHEIMPENVLWINSGEAEKLGIKNNDLVKVTSNDGSHSGTINANQD